MKKKLPIFLVPYKKRLLERFLPLRTIEVNGIKFRYLRSDAPPHNPRDFEEGIEFHQLVESLTGELAIDIGANIGSYTLRMASKFKEVIAFEPSRIHSRVLRINLRLNNMRNVHVYEAALSDSSGHATLYNRLGGAASLDSAHYGLVYNSMSVVRTLRLDDLLPKLRRLDFMKVDAEGLEQKILKGGMRLIPRLRPIIGLEVHSSAVPTKESCSCNTCSLLQGLDYEIKLTGMSSSVGQAHWVWASPKTPRVNA